MLALFVLVKDGFVNIIARFQLRGKHTFAIGDWLSIDGMKARVVKLNLTGVITETQDGDRLVIPLAYAVSGAVHIDASKL